MRVAYETMLAEFERVLKKYGFSVDRAHDAAEIFAQNSLAGVFSHGLNRFPVVVDYLKKGGIDPAAEAECVASFGAMERWDGHRGFGPLNAKRVMDRAVELAKPERYWVGGAGQQQPLDAGRHLRLAGDRSGLHRHLLVQYLPEYARMGCQGQPHRQ